MNGFRIGAWIVLSIAIFAAIYMTFESNHQVSVLQASVDSLRIDQEKIEYAFENRQRLDTIVVNVYSNVTSIQKMDTLNVKFSR